MAKRKRSRKPASKKKSRTRKSAARIRRYPFKNTLKVVQRYFSETFTLNPAVGSLVAHHFFRCNGLYDPDATGTGHQPIGFDQITTMYNRYMVYKAKIKVWYRSVDAVYPHWCGVSITDDITSNLDQRVLIENGNAAWKLQNRSPANDHVGIVTVKKTVYPTKWMNLGKKEADASGTSVGIPNRQCYFDVWTVPQNSSAVDGGGSAVNVLLTYYVIYSEPKELDLS